MIQHIRKHPLVSIVIVNFNGQHLLADCLQSLTQLQYPPEEFEVILVDNNSSDDSVPFVTRHFPSVRIVQNNENLGFTGGNQAGFDVATGEYIVLLNSDMAVDSLWLSTLVEAAADPAVGIISSRLRYATPFIELTISSTAVPKSKIYRTIDHSPIGVLIEDIHCATPVLSDMVYYKSGFYEKAMGEISSRRTTGEATVLLPFKVNQDSNTYALTLHGLDSTEEVVTPIDICINGKKYQHLDLKSHQTVQIELSVQRKDVEGSYHWLIQNAGNIVLSTGYSKDRGSVVVMKRNEHKEFYEEESKYFEQPAELLSACGASCLIKRKVIDEVGFLDGHYFMYYEDVELSLRAWRAGWKIIYEPKSIGYHKHRATSGNDESEQFLHFVERNHIALVLTHFPWETAMRQSLQFGLRFIYTALKSMVLQFKDNDIEAEIWRKKFEGRKAACKDLLMTWPRLLGQRLLLKKGWPINYSILKKVLY